MITISLCMIVKNEEAVLERCLNSLKGLVDEMVIVDTGSVDATKEIAAKYTDKIYDFAWTGSFSDARNFAFSKAGMEYIYSADADEVLDEENRERFRLLKETLLPEIEIVQMYYCNQLQHGSIYNYDKEYRPKLFKRLRSFTWNEAIHEEVLLTPVVYDSEVEILHMPKEKHAARDFAAFERIAETGERLSKRLHNIYAKELFISGETKDFVKAAPLFEKSFADTTRSPEELEEAACVMVHAAREKGDVKSLLKYALKSMAGEGCSEICYELGLFYQEEGDLEEAAVWFYNAAYETEPILSIRMGGDYPRQKLAECYKALGLSGEAEAYLTEAEEWKEENLHKNRYDRNNLLHDGNKTK